MVRSTVNDIPHAHRDGPIERGVARDSRFCPPPDLSGSVPVHQKRQQLSEATEVGALQRIEGRGSPGLSSPESVRFS